MIKKRFISMLVLLAAVATGAWAQDTYKIDAVCTYTANGQSQSQDLSIDDAASLPFTIKLSELDPFSMSNVEYNLDATNITVSGDNIVKGTDANWDTEITINGAGTATVSYGIQHTDYGELGSVTITFTVTKNAPAASTITVTWNNDDITGSGNSFTKDGVTITVGDYIDFDSKDFMNGGTFTTTLGNFTKIEVTTSEWDALGTGWSGSTWTGNASSVSFSGSIWGDGMGNTKFVFTIEPATVASTYTVTLKEGTDDADNWTITPAEATTTGVAAGTEVKATYGGAKKVKSVKAVKKAKPAATVTTAPTAKTGVKAGEDVAIVNEGAAEGGTMMYMVNATQPASTDGFSATVPTAEGLTAGTYYVWYYVKADDSHTDSEISASGIEVTIAAAETTVTWTSSDMPSDFYAYFDGWTYNNTHQGITVTASGDAQGGWSWNGIDVNEGSGTITFTSSVGNIKSIVITADNMNEIDEWSAPTGWTANNPWDNPPRTLSWSGTASASVNLPLSEGQNFSGISTIVFTLE